LRSTLRHRERSASSEKEKTLRAWKIRRYDRRLLTLGAALGAEFDSIEERDCPDLQDCIGEIHGLMYTALLSEPTDDFAYALWVDDDGETMPVYVMQKDPEHHGELWTLMTPDVSDLFDSINPGWWEEHVVSCDPNPE
jgi:hypothetical protein